MATANMTVTLEAHELVSAMQELQANINLYGPGNYGAEILQFIDDPSGLFTSTSEIRTTGGTREGVVALKPSQRFLDLVAAIRAPF